MLYAMLLDGKGVNLWEVVLHAGSVAKGVMLLLAAFSVVSWVIIFQKGTMLGRSRRITEKFRSAFRKSTSWNDFYKQTAKFEICPMVGLFNAGHSELSYQLRPLPGEKPQIRSMEAVERSLQRASVVEMGRMEKGLGILATIAAVSPFVGLFGTVWGIIDAFRGIGTTGSASLATVAIPISEALVATALGLVAAIPALMAYNFFQGQLKQWQTELDDFALEFISLTERNFT
nr:MotA/TolQ/ExbB proton channel family protein [uncultured Holophaga sp.]